MNEEHPPQDGCGCLYIYPSPSPASDTRFWYTHNGQPRPAHLQDAPPPPQNLIKIVCICLSLFHLYPPLHSLSLQPLTKTQKELWGCKSLPTLCGALPLLPIRLVLSTHFWPFRLHPDPVCIKVEGAVKEGGRQPSIWDVFSHTPGKIANNDTGDVADDQYHKYLTDIGLMQVFYSHVSEKKDKRNASIKQRRREGRWDERKLRSVHIFRVRLTL